LSEGELRKYFAMLAVEPNEMLHPGSFAKLGHDIADYNEPDALIALLVEHPEVMNRPLIVHGDRAVIARPSERVEEILD
jgi:arsenate reductase